MKLVRISGLNGKVVIYFLKGNNFINYLFNKIFFFLNNSLKIFNKYINVFYIRVIFFDKFKRLFNKVFIYLIILDFLSNEDFEFYLSRVLFFNRFSNILFINSVFLIGVNLIYRYLLKFLF